MAKGMVACVVIVLAACSKPAPPQAACAPAPSAPAIELSNVSVVGAIELINKRTTERITIEILAMPVATCEMVSVKVGAGARGTDVLDALEASISGSGLELRRGEGAHRLVSSGPKERWNPGGTGCSVPSAAFHKWVLAGVKKIDDTTVEIKRDHLRLWAEHFFAFYPSEVPDPGIRGIVIDDRRDFETPAGVGVRSGDRILSIADVPINWSTKADAVRKKVLEVDAIKVALERNGNPVTLTLKVVP
jgi:hypothetical protein